MFGLTFEKILLILLIAAFLIGPTRLPEYSARFARFVKGLRALVTQTQERLKDEMGEEFDEVDWKKLDPRQYDPRKIIRDALLEEPEKPAVEPAAEAAPDRSSPHPTTGG